MKVLMITSLSTNMDAIQGGVDAVVINLIKGFEYFKDLELRILSLGKSNEDYTKRITDHITIHYLSKSGIPGGNLFYYLFQASKQVRNSIMEFNPDIIHVQGASPILLSLRGINRKNLIITQHGIMAEEIKYQASLQGKLKFWIKKLIEQFYFTSFTNFTFISEKNREFLIKKKQIQDITGELIYNPVNPSFFDVKNKNGRTKKIIYVGVINPRKNLMCLLQAFNQVRNSMENAELMIVGGFTNAKYEQKIKQFIANNNLQNRVHFLGWKTQSEILKIYSEVDLFVLPSLQESLPVSIAEAMAASKPVIATDVGGVSEMITEGKSGFLIESNNFNQLGEYLREAFSEKFNYNAFSNYANDEAKLKFHPKNVAQQTIEFYQTVMKNAGS
ncbi:glycosyltransferase [Marinifilum sp. N1E240]|nr:glycosyltransferase [Marinifilum sp. N1E240]